MKSVLIVCTCDVILVDSSVRRPFLWKTNEYLWSLAVAGCPTIDS